VFVFNSNSAVFRAVGRQFLVLALLFMQLCADLYLTLIVLYFGLFMVYGQFYGFVGIIVICECGICIKR